MKYFLLLFFSCIFLFCRSQTLVMNEVSNGPSGNMEYVEFVVVDTNIVYNCVGVTNPPCIDIRGWIFDDNSGYHGTSGVAAGCIRFSNNALWSCIPVGTILLLYNNLDPNTSLPADDLSMLDGNCRIVAPVSNTTLFESNPTTPGAVACSYPASGWVAGGNWNTTLFANPGDCARIVNLAGCEVFSVCWGSDNLNTLIYMAGNASQKVYFFDNSVNNDPTNNSNWTNGTVVAPNQQTPGTPNNLANSNWINGMNNNCTLIQPLTVTSNTTIGTCPCMATASVSPSGSLPPFTYTWSPAPGSGQGTPLAGGLCTGTYSCFVRSSITKCTETVVVTVTNNNTFSTSASNQGTVCSGSNIQLNTPSASSYTWSGPAGFSSTLQNPIIPSASTSMSGTYTVYVSAGTCTAQAITSLTVSSLPTITITNNSPVCNGGLFILNGGGGGTLSWAGPNSFASSIPNNTVLATSANAGNYSLTITAPNSCSTIAITTVIVSPLPVITVSASGACIGGSLSLSSSGGNNFSWSGPNNFSSTNQNPIIANTSNSNSGTYSVVVTGSNSCINSGTVVVVITPTPLATIAGTAVCEGAALNLSANGGSVYLWNGPNGFVNTNQSVTINPSSLANSGIYTVTVSNNNCSNSATLYISINPLPTITASPIKNICIDSTCYFFASGGINYSWTGPSGYSSSQQNPIIRGVSKSNEGVYVVTTFDAKGCSNSYSVPVTVDICRCSPFIPEGFSPNNDGAHDTFSITCIEGRKTKIEIFNRWGNLVFKEDVYNNNWNGKTNSGINIVGEDLPSGTYYYFIKIDDEEKSRTGFITLWR